MQHKRLSLNHVRALHASIADARRAWGKDAGTLLSIWGRRIYSGGVPRCVYRHRHARWEREWVVIKAALDALPPPPPLPEGFVHGFSNGSEYDHWTYHNCDCCALAGDPGERGSSACEIFEAIHDAAASDGLFPVAIAERMGYTKTVPHWGACPEFAAATP